MPPTHTAMVIKLHNLRIGMASAKVGDSGLTEDIVMLARLLYKGGCFRADAKGDKKA
jgi:hypothetical protein